MGKKEYCKFCQSYDIDGVDSTFAEEDVLKHGFKFFGEEYEIYDYIEYGELKLGFSSGHANRDLAKKKINFCPMCGRSLKSPVPEK